MKTISPVAEQEKLSTEETSNNQSFSEISQEGYNERDNLIVCNSDLASSIHDVKLEKNRLNPGHYIHKVFLHKLKSQSASNLDKKKTDYLKSNTITEENNETVSPLMNGEECVHLEEVTKENNDTWFKTWPECGVDKCVIRNGKLLDDIANGTQNSEDLLKNRTYSGNILVNTSDPPSVPVVEECKKCRSSLQKCSCVAGSKTPKNAPISLDNLLHTLPLAYSPITKQIHIIKSNTNVPETSISSDVIENSLESHPCDLKNQCEKTLCRVSTEVSSFSSNVSSLSDISPSTNEDSVSGSLLDPGDSCSLVSIGNCSIISEDSVGAKPKRKGISSFFSRGVFGWKGKSESQCNGEGWSIFGRANGNSSCRASNLSVDRYSEDGQSVDSGRGVLGSTGLIQLERPAWLPAKSKQERQAHADQHDRIIHSARKRELKEAKQRKKLLQSQLKAEDELAHATKIWMHEILPRWKQAKLQRRTLDLWWQGVPPCVRGKLWYLAISNDLNITRELYDICVSRAQERLNSTRGSMDSMNETCKDADREASMELIQLDISRTFPHLCIFQKGGPYYDMLHCLLAAYVCYRPDVGYVQGMSFIAAVLILNMDAPDAFICFANLLNHPCHRAFYSLDQPLMEGYYATYKELLRENLPRLCAHLEASRLSPDLYLLDWLYTVFSKAMSLDVASRVWDVFLRDGDEFLFRTAIGVLHLYQDCLLGMDFLLGSQFLIRLPDDLTPAQLFKSVSSVRMSVAKRNFSQILASYTHPSG